MIIKNLTSAIGANTFTSVLTAGVTAYDTKWTSVTDGYEHTSSKDEPPWKVISKVFIVTTFVLTLVLSGFCVYHRRKINQQEVAN